MFRQYDFNEPWDSPNNRKLLASRPSTYAIHDKKSQTGTYTNYLAVVGNETVWPFDKSSSLDQIKDSLTSTILVVENHGADVQWTEPRDLEFRKMNMEIEAESPSGISSRFQPPAVVTTDWRVRTLEMELSPETLRALLTANGGEEIPVDSNSREIPDGRRRPLKE